MSDESIAIELVQGGKLSTDQLLQLHLNGQLRPPPGVRVQIVGSVPGYRDEAATFQADLAHELVRRGAGVYAS